MIRHVFYISDIAPGVNDQTIQVILATSRRNNWRLDVTGLPMCSCRHFAQVLEGRHDAVEQLVQKLSLDPRHSRIRVLLDETSSLRRYGDWEIGYLHNEGVGQELDRLGAASDMSEASGRALLGSLRPDTVMGSL